MSLPLHMTPDGLPVCIMLIKMPDPEFKLYYWPVPFRGCCVSYLFAYRDVALLEITDFKGIEAQMNAHPSEQSVLFIGPPVLRNRDTKQALSQMPSIVLFASRELGLTPEDPFEEAMCVKVLMDCNDILMELCLYNGSIMWERERWIDFRRQRFPHWLQLLEESAKRGFLGQDSVTFADISVFALLGNLTRCLPELEADVLSYAPGLHALCLKIGSKPSLALHVADQGKKYGQTYCGGLIEQSIRKMLEMDAD